MNITILTNNDLASNLALNQLLPALTADHRVQVFLSGRVGGSGPSHPDLAMLKFLEQTLFTELLFPALGDGVGEGRARYAGFSRLCADLGAGLAPLDRINSEPGLETLRGAAPDLVLSIRYGGILRDAAIAVPRLGVLNLHSGLLPDYRGVMATFRAMDDGVDTIGTTLHYIRDAGIDTGDIVATSTRPVDYRSSYLANVLALYPGGCELMLQAVASLAAGETLETWPQPSGGNYYSFPDDTALQHFYARGCRLYDVDEIAAVARSYLESPL
ncbi:formyl transferase [Parahaliea maris]|uniref:Formyl transferase n=1 Tax=Parahaliea maris TaxID=2716870 RepID=A0A5C9A1Z0_9GAMM|nr:formyl transferase [Parahaliea maris]TXS94079.1 formyl transferase [Parahaliea maris]